jgi:hypothetical protein
MIYLVAAEFAAPQRKEPVARWLGEHFERLAEPLPQLWIVDGPLAAEQIASGLAPLLARDDRLVVVKAATEAVWRGLAPADAGWLAAAFPGSISERIPDPAEGTARR